MNILIRFEDIKGCHSLFDYRMSSYFKNCNLKVTYGLGNKTLVINKRIIDYYDLIICVFDLDSIDKGGLMISEERFRKLTGNLLLKLDKIVLIPVFFCFETILLYCYQFKNIIHQIKTYQEYFGDFRDEVLLNYIDLYDYSQLSPDNLNDYYSKIILNNINNKLLYPQQFQQNYIKQLLLNMYNNVDIFILNRNFKSIDKLLKYLESLKPINNNTHITMDLILDCFEKVSDYNDEFRNLLYTEDLCEMKKYSGKENYDRILILLYDYRAELYSLRDYDFIEQGDLSDAEYLECINFK